MTTQPTHAAVEAVWRIESARLVAGLARFVGDLGLAEELAQDALVAALEQWPAEGVPANPGGWLMSTAKHRAIDQLRRRQNYQRKLTEVGRMLEQQPFDQPDPDDYVPDDLLRLVFIACHPVLRTEGRVALTLRLLGGLSALDRVQTLGGDFGPYALQAAIAATHARAETVAETDWARIAALYRVLVEVSPSPVAELNRAVAVGMANGPAAGLAIADSLAGEKALRGYPHLPAVRGDLLAQLGRTEEARAEFERAAGLSGNTAERAVFLGRAEQPDRSGHGPAPG